MRSSDAHLRQTRYETVRYGTNDVPSRLTYANRVFRRSRERSIKRVEPINVALSATSLRGTAIRRDRNWVMTNADRFCRDGLSRLDLDLTAVM